MVNNDWLIYLILPSETPSRESSLKTDFLYYFKKLEHTQNEWENPYNPLKMNFIPVGMSFLRIQTGVLLSEKYGKYSWQMKLIPFVGLF